MMMKFRALLIAMMAIHLTGCVEQVNIDDYIDGRQSGSIVVEGLITNENKIHEVRLSRSGKVITDYYEAVTGADVTISDGVQTFLLKEKTPGVYTTDSIKGIAGRLYTMTAKYDNQIYVASDTMKAVSDFDKADAFRMSANTPPQGYIESPLIIFGSDHPSMLDIRIDNPLPNAKYTHFTYFAFPGIDPDYILPKFVDAALYYTQGTKLTQTKYSLSQAHYSFLRALLLETEYKGGIFGSVRSDVPTNVSNGGHGFFAASAIIQRSGMVGPDGKLH